MPHQCASRICKLIPRMLYRASRTNQTAVSDLTLWFMLQFNKITISMDILNLRCKRVIFSFFISSFELWKNFFFLTYYTHEFINIHLDVVNFLIVRDKKKESWINLKIFKKKDLEKEKFLYLKWLVYFVQLKKKSKQISATISKKIAFNTLRKPLCISLQIKVITLISVEFSFLPFRTIFPRERKWTQVV